MKILIIEDDIVDLIVLQTHLKNIHDLGELKILHTTSLNETRLLKETENPDLIFLDLILLDSIGINSFLSVNALFPSATIIIMSGMYDRHISSQAIQAGAQDFIVKGEFDKKLLQKTIQYSRERKQNEIRLKESNLRFELVSKATNDTIWDWNLFTNEISWNNNVDIFGYRPDVRKDEAWRESNIHPSDKKRVIEKLKQHLKSKSDNWSDSYRFCCFDGTYKYIQDRGYILRDKDGKACRMIGSMEDMTQSVMLQKELDKERAQRQKEILKAVIAGQEKEKRQLAEELHDNVNQLLASIKMYLGIAKSNHAESKEMVEKCYKYIEEVMREIRTLSHSLAAPTLGDLSLGEAIRHLVDEVNSAKKIFITLIDATKGEDIGKEKELTLYRIAQEQISNIVKHSNASQVTASLKVKDDKVLLTFEDNGIGFDPKCIQEGIGLRNIGNRVSVYSGKVNLQASQGAGCTLEVSIPR